MIKIENTEVFGFEAAIRGCRNPLNSWAKSDSGWCSIPPDDLPFVEPEYVIGENDLTLMKKLVKAGSDHSKFMRMINVTFDITAPLYYFKQLDTYKVGTVANSCSTMHKIADKEFTFDDFSCEHLNGRSRDWLHDIINELNMNREFYIETKDKEYWWQMIQLLPSSYNQRRTMQMNYAVLRNIYHSRKDHKLDCWKDFCKWIETLPYSELITD